MLKDCELTKTEQAYFAPGLPRVAGVESEYGVGYLLDGAVATGEDGIHSSKYIEAMKHLHPDIPWMGDMSLMGRWYSDFGDHPEHASNEYLDYLELAYAKVGADTLLVEAVKKQ